MFVVVFILFLFFSTYSLLFWVALWQLKEYRFDRLSVHLKDTIQGRKALVSSESTLLLIGFVVYIFSTFSDIAALYFPYIVLTIFLIFSMKVFWKILGKKVKRPVFTLKAISISLLSFACITTLSLNSLTDPFLWLILVAISIPIVVGGIVLLFSFPTEIYTDIQILKAKKKRRRLRNLQVIAVSGSYGKSSTKEVIAHVLSKKFTVVKTDFSHNTPLAIAKVLQEQVTYTTDFLIVEVGAYKRGEIRQICDMIEPTISVTTAISDQHLALYGSMNDVILSELELIHALPVNALVLLNRNSKAMKEFSDKIKQRHIVWYSMSNTSRVAPTKNGVNWTYSFEKTSLPIHSPLLGIHTIENILPAIFLGFYFKLTSNQIKNTINSLVTLPKTMEKISLYPGVTAIDDTFNASPESVLSAVAYLQLFKKRKYLVLSPLIELGKMARERHVEIGQHIAHLDSVWVTSKNFLKEIQEGILSKKGKVKILTGSYKDIALSIKKSLRKEDVIVFEGKEAGIVLHYL